MITAIFMFIATSIAIIIYTIYYFRWFALFFLLLLTLIIYIKVRRNIKKYGPNSIFRAFRKYPTDNEQLKLVKHILKDKFKMNFIFELDSKIIIAVSKSEIYILKVLDAVGKVSGKLTDTTLLIKQKEATVIPNFFRELDTIEKNIKNEIKNAYIKKIIVKKGICMFEIPYSKQYIVAGMHNFYYQLQNFEKKINYTEEQVKIIGVRLSNNLSKNVKLEENTCTQHKSKLQSK